MVGGSGFVDLALGPAVGYAAAGALYGAATGVVLAMIVRRSED